MKSAILITARLKSTRLPYKVIKPIHGQPMIRHMLDRLKLAAVPEKIIICTSPVAQDDPLEDIAAREGVECFRGDPVDVLARLAAAARAYEVETVINCTADNPFVDPVYIDRLFDFHRREGNEFTKINGLLFGVFSYAISTEALHRACEIKNEQDTEVWHGYFMDTGLFRWSALDVTDPAVTWPDLRLTVDTPEDFAMVTRVFDELHEPGRVFPLEAIIDLCRKKPEIPAINATVTQKPGLPIKVREADHE